MLSEHIKNEKEKNQSFKFWIWYQFSKISGDRRSTVRLGETNLRNAPQCLDSSLQNFPVIPEIAGHWYRCEWKHRQHLPPCKVVSTTDSVDSGDRRRYLAEEIEKRSLRWMESWSETLFTMRRRVSFDTFASCWIHSVDSIKWIPVRLSVMAFHTGSLCVWCERDRHEEQETRSCQAIGLWTCASPWTRFWHKQRW